MSTCKWAVWAAAGVVACVLTWAGSVTAQPTSLPPSLTKTSIDMGTIKRQLQMAQRLGKTAIQGLQASPVDNSVPLDASTIRASRETYVLIRAAKEGLELKKDRARVKKDRQNEFDPALELAYKRVFEAWNLSRTPTDKLSWNMPRARYLAMSVRDMEQALRLVDQALAILP